MSALLVLLFLLSVATIASRPTALSGLIDRAFTPILIIAGVACQPVALAVLSPSMIHSLQPALAVGVTWLGILVGLRSSSHDFGFGEGGRSSLRAGIVVILSTAVSVLLAMAAIAAPQLLGWRHSDATPLLAGAALIIGGALVGSPPVDNSNRVDVDMRSHLMDFGDLVAMCCAVVALAILPPWSPLPPSLSAVVVVGGGLLLALMQRLLGGNASGDAATRIIALLGIVAIGAGLLHDAGLPSAVSGLVAGAAIGRTELGRALRETLSPTERPARIVVVFLVGTMIPLSSVALLVGVLLALGQLAVQLVATSWAVGHRPRSGALASGMSSSAVPLVITASYALAGLPEGELLLATAAIAVLTTDVLAAAIAIVSRVRAPSAPIRISAISATSSTSSGKVKAATPAALSTPDTKAAP